MCSCVQVLYKCYSVSIFVSVQWLLISGVCLFVCALNVRQCLSAQKRQRDQSSVAVNSPNAFSKTSSVSQNTPKLSRLSITSKVCSFYVVVVGAKSRPCFIVDRLFKERFCQVIDRNQTEQQNVNLT